jgi:acetyl-CoA carboxylase biotin carboxyl carrier protein
VEPHRIKAFIDAMAASDLDELELRQDGWTLRLVRRAGGATTAQTALAPHAAAADASDTPALRDEPAAPHEERTPQIAARELTSPLYGIVHLQQAPGEPPFVHVGATVAAGRTLCVIEAMKVFHEVCADRDGTVAAVLVASGEEVEAGQPLFRFA